jgi:hypothetical protein
MVGCELTNYQRYELFLISACLAFAANKEQFYTVSVQYISIKASKTIRENVNSLWNKPS